MDLCLDALHSARLNKSSSHAQTHCIFSWIFNYGSTTGSHHRRVLVGRNINTVAVVGTIIIILHDHHHHPTTILIIIILHHHHHHHHHGR
jgi:hypothetical protein